VPLCSPIKIRQFWEKRIASILIIWILNTEAKYSSETEQMCTDLLRDAIHNIEYFLSTAARSRRRGLINQEMCAPPADHVAFRNFYLVVLKRFKVYRKRVMYINHASFSATLLHRSIYFQQMSCDVPSICTRNCRQKVPVDMSGFKQNWKTSPNSCTIRQKWISIKQCRLFIRTYSAATSRQTRITRLVIGCVRRLSHRQRAMGENAANGLTNEASGVWRNSN
jgi:hypothetical protein